MNYMYTINPEKINELKQLDEDGSNSTLKHFITMFLDSTPAKIKKMVEFYYLKDFPALKKEAQPVRVACVSIGADILSQYAFEIENLKNSKDIENEMGNLIKKTHKEFQLVKTELEKHL